jgi:hypothetical protein
MEAHEFLFQERNSTIHMVSILTSTGDLIRADFIDAKRSFIQAAFRLIHPSLKENLLASAIRP